MEDKSRTCTSIEVLCGILAAGSVFASGGRHPFTHVQRWPRQSASYPALSSGQPMFGKRLPQALPRWTSHLDVQWALALAE